jgi:hypothetical protein
MKAAALIAMRMAMNSTWPSRMSVGSSGDDTAGWYGPSRIRPRATGNADSMMPFCMDAAASMPGAKKARYDTPPRACAATEPSAGVTRRPRPAPIATRNSTGLATLTTTVPRQRRRYWRAQYWNSRRM